MNLVEEIHALYSRGLPEREVLEELGNILAAPPPSPETIPPPPATCTNCVRLSSLAINANAQCCATCLNGSHESSCELREQLRLNGPRLTIVVDTSGSMEPLLSEVVTGLNGFVSDQKTNGSATLHVSTFDTSVRDVFVGTIDDAPVFRAGNDGHFKAQGLTALFDAIGNAVFATDEVVPATGTMHPSIAPVVVVFTDGSDNSSTQFDSSSIRSMISTRKNMGWTFLFFGCSQDATLNGGEMGIDAANCQSYSATPDSQAQAYRTASSMVRPRKVCL